MNRMTPTQRAILKIKHWRFLLREIWNDKERLELFWGGIFLVVAGFCFLGTKLDPDYNLSTTIENIELAQLAKKTDATFIEYEDGNFYLSTSKVEDGETVPDKRVATITDDVTEEEQERVRMKIALNQRRYFEIQVENHIVVRYNGTLDVMFNKGTPFLGMLLCMWGGFMKDWAENS